MKSKQKSIEGFTLIELLVVVAILGILLSVILMSLKKSRTDARINGLKTSLSSTLPMIVSCKDSNGIISQPTGSETGNTQICSIPPNPNVFWPKLSYGYTYSIGTYNSSTCNFRVSTGSDVVVSSGNTYITCDCSSQRCQ